MKIICYNCDHKWRYTSKSKYVTCPNCLENWTLTEDEQERHKLQEGYVFLEEEDPEEVTDEEVKYIINKQYEETVQGDKQ